ncbi:MAG: dihydroneopterin aldolase [Actinobacteria bacterium]|nr:MAG: dihydroneopterin aldolase [Actinomycetota bacterium]
MFVRSTWVGRIRTVSRGSSPSHWSGDRPAHRGGTFVTTSRLFLTGIAASGRHGANPGEKDQPQDFVVDLDVEVDVASDDIAATADYRTLIQTARDVVAGGSLDLLESLAGEVARAVSRLPRVVTATAIVHKPAAARSSQIEGIAAAATAESQG